MKVTLPSALLPLGWLDKAVTGSDAHPMQTFQFASLVYIFNSPEVCLSPYILQETPEHLHRAAAANVSHHLGKLVREGSVERTSGETFRLASNSKP